MERMTALWLMPFVAAEVAAVSGGLLVPHLAASEAVNVLVLSYVLWAFSVPLAMSILVILLLRLVLHKLPERDMAASGWLALGPIGTGALGLLVLGSNAPRVFAAQGMEGVGEVAFGLGVIGGVMLWGYGLWWLLLAILKTARYLRGGLPFNLGWWGFTFPLGVYSLATVALANAMHLVVFRRHRRRVDRVSRGALADRGNADHTRGVARRAVRGAVPAFRSRSGQVRSGRGLAELPRGRGAFRGRRALDRRR